MREIIAEELDRHRIERTAREVAPIVTALRAHADDVPRSPSSSGTRAKLDALDPAARDAVEQLTRSIVNKLLHEPTVRVKDAAGTRARRALRRRARRAVRRSDDADPDALMPRPLRVATRGSELARWQADRVAALLGADAELVVVITTTATSAPTSPSTRSAAPACS